MASIAATFNGGAALGCKGAWWNYLTLSDRLWYHC
jgi:hypothetical protein